MNKKDYMLLEYLCEKYGADIIEEGLFKKLGPTLAAGALTLTGGVGVHNALNHRTADEPKAIEQSVSLADQIPNYHELVQAVKEYMNWAVNCIGHDYSEIEIKPETLVELSYEYEYDLQIVRGGILLQYLRLPVCLRPRLLLGQSFHSQTILLFHYNAAATV